LINPEWDVTWASKLMDSNIADGSDPIKMEQFKRILRTAAEDGGQWDRALTILEGLQVKIDRSFDKIEATLDK
jgi:aminopeptidase C